MKNILRIFIPIMALAIVGIGLLAFQGIDHERAEYTYEKNDLSKTFTISGKGQAEVTTSGGKIEVVGQSGNKAVVTAIVKKNGRTLDANSEAWHEALEDYELRIDQEGDKVIAYAKRVNKSSWGWGKNASISFELSVPHAMTTDLKTSGGSIMIDDLKGDQRLKTSGGSIKIEDIDGEIVGVTSGGSIKVLNQNGKVDIHTSGGSITVENAQGPIDARTSGGGISLHNTDGKVDVSTSGGRINITGKSSSIKATTSGGGITADVTGISESVYLKTSGGNIKATLDKSLGLDLDLSGNSVDAELHNFSGSQKKNKVNGTMNGGGIDVYMHTSGGRVVCSFQ